MVFFYCPKNEVKTVEEMQTLFDHLNALMDKGDYNTLKQELNDENAADLAEYFEELPAEKQLFIFRLLT